MHPPPWERRPPAPWTRSEFSETRESWRESALPLGWRFETVVSLVCWADPTGPIYLNQLRSAGTYPVGPENILGPAHLSVVQQWRRAS